MNNAENNHHDGIAPVTPITPNSIESQINQNNISGEQIAKVAEQTTQMTSPVSSTTIQNNQVPISNPNLNSTIPSIVTSPSPNMSNQKQIINSIPTVPITPMPATNNASSNNNVVSPTSLSGDSLISISPNNIIPPQFKDSQQTNQTINNITPGLQLDASNPFDIGINSPLMPTMPESKAINQTPISNSTPITPISVSTPNNNQTLSNNNPLPPSPDINPPTQNTSNDNIVSVGTYLINIILYSIPLVGLILMIKSLKNNNKNISNFAKAELILVIVISLIGVVFSGFISSTITNIITNSNGNTEVSTTNY